MIDYSVFNISYGVGWNYTTKVVALVQHDFMARIGATFDVMFETAQPFSLTTTPKDVLGRDTMTAY